MNPWMAGVRIDGAASGRAAMNSVRLDPRIERGMRAQLALRAERIAAGDKPLGWKVGFGAPAAMKKLQIEAPLVGFLMERALLRSGASIPVGQWTRPAAEAEIAVHMERALSGGAERAVAAAAIAGLSPAIEIADVEFPPDDVERILAADIYQRHVILGPWDASRAGCRLDGLDCRVSRNGGEVARTSDPQALTGDYIDIVRHVADVLEACGERLRAGDIIITGSITPPLWVEAGDEVRFELEPVGALSASFKR
jgi:2-keto-4-pentenoate hydratase